MIEFKIEGKLYTEDQYKRDLIRMFDSVRKSYLGEASCMSVNCDECPLGKKCCPSTDEDEFYNLCLEAVKATYKWAKEHPVVTNRDKFIEVFGSNPPINTMYNFVKWLDEEYKGDQKIENEKQR